MTGTLINVLEKESRKKTATVLIFLIKRCNDLLNIGAKLNDLQIATLASDLMDFCQQETLEDIVMVFKMARKGQLSGKIYRLDSIIVLQEWLPAYLELKYQEREQLLEKKKGEIAAAENKIDKWSPEANKNIRKIIVGLISEKPKVAKPTEDYLQNSDSFKIKLAEELKTCTKKELIKLKKEYSYRLSHKPYLQIVKDELKSRIKK